MYIQVNEKDNYENESTMVSIACDDMQLGTNSIPVHLEENSKALENVADVFKSAFSTSWKFFDDAVEPYLQLINED